MMIHSVVVLTLVVVGLSVDLSMGGCIVVMILYPVVLMVMRRAVLYLSLAVVAVDVCAVGDVVVVRGLGVLLGCLPVVVVFVGAGV